MRIDTRHHYRAEPEAVHTMLTDPAFWQSLQDPHVTSCEASPTADGVQVLLQVAAPAEAVRVTGPVIHATLQAGWERTKNGWAGPIGLTVKGLPASFKGTCTIEPAGAGTSVEYAGALVVRLPLVGAGIEAMAAPYLMSVIDAQQEAGDQWLTTHKG